MAGASAAFFIGRTLGREFAASLIGNRLRKYDDSIEKNGFATVLYLRLLYFPFTPMNFGMGLTKVRFRDYFVGTGLGIIIGTFIYTFFVGTLREIWGSGQWSRLISPRVFFSVGLFALFIFHPEDDSENPGTRIGYQTCQGRLYGASVFLLNIRQDQVKGDAHLERKAIGESKGIF